jgi:hypothetical protein
VHAVVLSIKTNKTTFGSFLWNATSKKSTKLKHFDVSHHQTRYCHWAIKNPQNESADERKVKGFTNPFYFRFVVRQPYTSETMGIQKIGRDERGDILAW